MISRPIPLASFASVMGIAGLGLAWRLAVNAFGVDWRIGEALIFIAAVLFAVLLVAWIARDLRHPDELRAERHVAITASYFGTITISCSLLAAGLLPYSRIAGEVLWIVAAFGGAALILYLVGYWIEHGMEAFEVTPALFIPVVGNATAVYASVPLGFRELGWASFSFAVVCWLTIAPIAMYRLWVTPPRLPRKMAPQLAVMVSSPAVLASAWHLLNGAGDAIFKILAYKALFFALLTLRTWKIGWGEPYNVAMWGYTFPAAALAGAFLRYAIDTHSRFVTAIAILALASATLIVALCVAFTLYGWISRATARIEQKPAT